jgi:ABC-type dipeptide/oligopeptide/nickel transport system permease subunit
VRRLGLGLLCGLALTALCADLIASDLPLYCKLGEEAYLLPCLTHPELLRGEDQQTLMRRASAIIPTPIPYGPLAQRPGGTMSPLSAPGGDHWLGTDDRGRDVAARLVHGTRVACLVGPLAVIAYLLFGALVGAACAASRTADAIFARLIDAGLTIPPLLLLLLVQGLSGSGSVLQVAIVIALAEWPQAARLVRGEALRVATREHVIAARALGAGPVRVAALHVLPLALGPLWVIGGFGLGQAVLFESALSFLGFGIAPPQASWGELLAQAAAHPQPWLLWPPAIAIALCVIAARLAFEGSEGVGQA